ncbi:MAG: helix-turn-helix domain-containing protein [Chitinophagia bacterium]
MNQFGKKIKELRLKFGLLQNDVASELNIDAPMLSKIENGTRQIRREQISILEKMFNKNKDELLVLWLSDRILDVIKDERLANKAIELADKNINIKNNI